MTTPALTTAGRLPDHRRPLIAAVLLLAVCGVWAFAATGAVRDRSGEYRRLAADGVRENDRVVELGVQDASLAARSVIVTASNGVQAYVELEGSRERVTSPGGTIPVVLDRRDPSAVGFGAAPDILDRSFLGAYLRAAAGPLLAVVALLLLGGGWTARRRTGAGRAGLTPG